MYFNTVEESDRWWRSQLAAITTHLTIAEKNGQEIAEVWAAIKELRSDIYDIRREMSKASRIKPLKHKNK